MKLNNDQFEALVYIFERENGNKKTEYENRIISESGLADFRPEILEENVVKALEDGIYESSTDRISAYWALGKKFNKNLIPLFRKWLRKEFDLKNTQAVYQLLISLENLEEKAFSLKREAGSASYEVELNMRDAEIYLSKNTLH